MTQLHRTIMVSWFLVLFCTATGFAVYATMASMLGY